MGQKKSFAQKALYFRTFTIFWHGGFDTWHGLGINGGKAKRKGPHGAGQARRKPNGGFTMYSFHQFHEAGTAEQVARAEFYAGAIDASVAQRASRRADSRLLFLALCWAATVADIPPCPEELKAWSPDSPEAIPEEPPSGKTGKEAAAYFRTVCQHLESWPRQADGTPVGPESVTRRPSEATTAFLAGLDESEANAIRALASAAVRFGDRTRQKAASGSRKRKAEAGQAEGANASGSRKAEAEGKAGQAEGASKPDFTGMDPLTAAAAALKWAAEAAREAAELAAKAADNPAAPDTVKEAASFAAKAEKLAAKAASLAGMQ